MENGAPIRIRTCDLRLRRATLYPAELRVHTVREVLTPCLREISIAVKRKRYSVEQIVTILKQAEMGTPVADLIRHAGITEQTFYRWKKHTPVLRATRSVS